MSLAQPTLADVWQLFQETDRLIKTYAQEAALRSQELDRRFEETDRLLKEQAQKTEKKLDKLETLFNSQWSRLMEALVDGCLVALLNQRGIPVEQTTSRTKGCHNGHNWEFDIIAINGQAVAIVEVKTTLRPQDVTHFVKKLRDAKTWMKQYSTNTIYGAMAYLIADAGAEVMAQNQGLLVIRATREGAAILNESDFVPKTW